jgi:hypothetical protein
MQLKVVWRACVTKQRFIGRNQREGVMIKVLRIVLPLLAGIVALSAMGGVGTAQAAAAAKCNVAWDCHGPLPFICMRCSTGQYECAHWACVRHTCAVQTCPKK